MWEWRLSQGTPSFSGKQAVPLDRPPDLGPLVTVSSFCLQGPRMLWKRV